MISVSQDGFGDYCCIQEAIDAARAHETIYIRKGVYKEKVIIEKSNLLIIGEDKDQTIVTYDDYAYKLLPDGTKMGTFRSFSCLLGGDRLHISNLTFENNSGWGPEIGQGIAAYVDGDEIRFKNCRFLGNQDTLFTGPLPPSPKIPGSFIGPRENATYKRSRQYYEACYIEGDVDFIFGSALALFLRCEVHSKNRGQPSNGYITAASTSKDEPFGYIFMYCHLTSDIRVPSVYLGRPWRPYAKVRYIGCHMGPHIFKEGWDPWDEEDHKKTTEFCEYSSTGPGGISEQRVSWAKVVTAPPVSC